MQPYLLSGNAAQNHISSVGITHSCLKLPVNIYIISIDLRREGLGGLPLNRNTVLCPLHKLTLQLEVAWGRDGITTGYILILFLNIGEVGEAVGSKKIVRGLWKDVCICTKEGGVV